MTDQQKLIRQALSFLGKKGVHSWCQKREQIFGVEMAAVVLGLHCTDFIHIGNAAHSLVVEHIREL